MSAERLRKAASLIRHDGRGDDGFLIAVADWLGDIATRHAADPEPMELTLHYDEECPTGECEDPGYHSGCIVCAGCYPTYDGMEGHILYPCRETKAALAVADAYLGAAS